MTEPRRLPRISIAVPSSNQGRYIRETLESLVSQAYPNLEVFIQDGGSTDGEFFIPASSTGVRTIAKLSVLLLEQRIESE